MSSANLASPYGGLASPRHEPHPDDFGFGGLRRNALAAGIVGEAVPYPAILSARFHGRFADYALEDGELVGRVHGEPRSVRRRITGGELASRATQQVGKSPSRVDWDAAAELLRDRVAAEQGYLAPPVAPAPVAADPGEPLTADSTPKPGSWMRRRPPP